MTPDELRKQVSIELQLLSQTIAAIQDGLTAIGSHTPTSLERAGFGALLTDIYKGIENTLKRLATFEEIPLPTGERWHLELFNRFTDPLPSGRPPLFDELTRDELKDYRNFRHLVVHGYGIMLKWELMKGLVERAPAALDMFRDCVDKYLGNVSIEVSSDAEDQPASI